MKHRLVEYLATEKGFTIFSIEASTPEAYRVSESVDPVKAPLVRAKNKTFTKSSNGSPFGAATWTFPVEEARGKTVRYSGSIKTEGVDVGWAGLWWRADKGKTTAVVFDNMSDRGARGTSDWGVYVLELNVPADATHINFGVLMPGPGTAWFDDLTVELDGELWASDAFDFGFESGSLPDGFHSRNDNYHTSVASNVALTGNRSLRIECLQAPGDPSDPTGSVGAAAAIVAILDENQDAYVLASSVEAFEWARHNADIVHQCVRMRQGHGGNIRDEAMAQSVEWILDRNPGAKIVLWAHNSHVSRDHRWMGDHLARRYGNDYIPTAFTTRSGTYTAWSEKAPAENELAEPGPASIEAFFIGAEQSLCFLDVRRTSRDDPASNWLYEDREMRGIGARAMAEQFRPVRAASFWDILIYIEETTAAR